MSSHEERGWLGGGAESSAHPWWPASSAADQAVSQEHHFATPLPFGYKMPAHFQAASSAGGATTAGVPSYVHQTPQAHWWYSGQQADLRHRVQTQTKATMSKSKSEIKPRGRMTAYAFFVQICREEHKKHHPTEHVAFADFSKKCAERWKTMTDKEKKRFQDMAEKDKKRYESEMKDYIPSENEKGRRFKKRKQIKDPNAPKRALSAFFWFCNDERGKVKQANPQLSVGDIAKELGRRWSEATPTVKSKYEELADKDKARYDREMTEYKKRGKLPAPVVLDTKEEGVVGGNV